MRILVLILSLSLIGRASDWYASTNGSGNGSIASPWSLPVALTNSSVTSGDTIWLRAGTYSPTTTNSHSFNSLQWFVKLVGATNNLITIQPYPNEAVRIDRWWYFETAGYLRIRDLEFYDSMKGSNAVDPSFPDGPWVHFQSNGMGPGGNEWINCLIHDVDNVWEKEISGNSVRGCIIWHAGLPTDLEHVCYPSPQSFVGNISAWHANDVIEHIGPDNFVMQSNIIFGTGQTEYGGGRDVLADSSGKSWTIDNNYLYNRFTNQPVRGYPQSFSYLGGATCVLNSNVIAGPSPVVFQDSSFASVTMLNNIIHLTFWTVDPQYNVNRIGNQGVWTVNNNHYTAETPSIVQFREYQTNYYNFSQWKSNNSGFDTLSTSSDSSLPSDAVYIVSNADQPKRAHIAVYNFSHADNVTVDISSVLNPGNTYQLISAQNYNAGLIKSGTIIGTTITVPMTNLTAAPVLYGTNYVVPWSGISLTNPPTTSPEFGAFVLLGSDPNPYIRVVP